MSSLAEVKAFQKRGRAKRKAARTFKQKINTRLLEAAADALLFAYAQNDDGNGCIDWDDLNSAFALAKRALPGRYRALVQEVNDAATIAEGGLA